MRKVDDREEKGKLTAVRRPTGTPTACANWIGLFALFVSVQCLTDYTCENKLRLGKDYKKYFPKKFAIYLLLKNDIQIVKIDFYDIGDSAYICDQQFLEGHAPLNNVTKMIISICRRNLNMFMLYSSRKKFNLRNIPL